MESNIKASFIPDKLPSSEGRGRGSQSPKGGIGDIFILIAVVTLAVALALAAGVFLYASYLSSSIQSKGDQLTRAEQSFEPALVEELVRLDQRLAASNDVLSRHLAPSEVFNLLEELTLQSVSFSAMDYSVGEDDTITLKLHGKARTVNGVALQASVFGQHNAITNPIFSNLNLVGDGVEFDVTSTVNPAALRYTTVFQNYSTGVQESATVPSEEIPAATTTATTNTEPAATTEQQVPTGQGDAGANPETTSGAGTIIQ